MTLSLTLGIAAVVVVAGVAVFLWLGHDRGGRHTYEATLTPEEKLELSEYISAGGTWEMHRDIARQSKPAVENHMRRAFHGEI